MIEDNIRESPKKQKKDKEEMEYHIESIKKENVETLKNFKK